MTDPSFESEARRLAETWDCLAEDDPYWAVLAEPTKLDHGWSEDEFFETGRSAILAILGMASEAGFAPLNVNRALDFGCGVGRLSQALANHFGAVEGVDVSEKMIALARRLNGFPSQVTYVRGSKDILKAYPNNRFDFIVSLLVLQHMTSTLSRDCVREFIRILSPGGLLVIQVPASLGPISTIWSTYNRLVEKLPDRASLSLRRVTSSLLLRQFLRRRDPTMMINKPQVKDILVAAGGAIRVFNPPYSAGGTRDVLYLFKKSQT